MGKATRELGQYRHGEDWEGVRRQYRFTADLKECKLLDTAWPTGKNYKTKRIDSVTCSDTKRPQHEKHRD